jgi:hypothetical protein
MWIVKAKRAPSCCSACGKIGALFRRPRGLEDGVREAIAQRLGTEPVVRRRIADMLSSRLLLKTSKGTAHGNH